MRNRRAPKPRAEDLLAEALDYATALQLIAVALFSLKDDRAKASTPSHGRLRVA